MVQIAASHHCPQNAESRHSSERYTAIVAAECRSVKLVEDKKALALQGRERLNLCPLVLTGCAPRVVAPSSSCHPSTPVRKAELRRHELLAR